MAQWLVFHLTDRCPLRCVHCLRQPAEHPTDLPFEVIARVLDEAGPLHGLSHVGLTGGEPLAYPRFPEVLDAVAGRGFTWHVVTSGHRFDRLVRLLEEAPARRQALRIVNLSLDGAEEATHDALRGAGSWRDAMAAAATCTARGLPFSFNVTVSAVNAPELERMGLLAAELGAQRIGYAMTQATGRPDDARLYLSPDQLDQVRDRVERLGGVLRIPVQAAEGFRRAERHHACEPFRTDVLHVDPRGWLNLCCMHSGVPGADADVAGDLAVMTLAEAQRRLLGLIHELRLAELARLELGPAEGWEAFQCNQCLKRMGKPFWSGAGSAGPPALRGSR
jgi:MoaA/NifB/PqqE/SkfB family radical SAM enzyme